MLGESFGGGGGGRVLVVGVCFGKGAVSPCRAFPGGALGGPLGILMLSKLFESFWSIFRPLEAFWQGLLGDVRGFGAG